MDDDQWMYIYTSLDQLVQDIEPAFLDDITAAFDGHARLLQLDMPREEVCVELRSAEPLLGQLQNHVEEFFALWTHDDPPERLDEPHEYTQSVANAYARKQERRRKKT
ncbi:hypothetical protein ACFC08_34340 [Streptomyces sp. NPDC056112]|uniref:hypothetical protein n=1 Tax=unclassified Streptomyces TaxID=2593676 RepID=UPI0024816403|nr:hypothetical protein [Streptomyces sp. HYC2]